MTAFRTPFTIVYASDVERSARFYEGAFGFERTFRWPLEGELDYAFLRLGDHGLGIGRHAVAGARVVAPAPDAPPRFELCIYTDDVDAAAERLRELGAPELLAPQDMPWHERVAYFADPDGNPIHVAAPIARPDADG